MFLSLKQLRLGLVLAYSASFFVSPQASASTRLLPPISPLKNIYQVSQLPPIRPFFEAASTFSLKAPALMLVMVKNLMAAAPMVKYAPTHDTELDLGDSSKTIRALQRKLAPFSSSKKQIESK